jgi:hypothetical protein
MNYWYPDEDRCWRAYKLEAARKHNGLLYAAFSTGYVSWYGKWRFGD